MGNLDAILFCNSETYLSCKKNHDIKTIFTTVDYLQSRLFKVYRLADDVGRTHVIISMIDLIAYYIKKNLNKTFKRRVGIRFSSKTTMFPSTLPGRVPGSVYNLKSTAMRNIKFQRRQLPFVRMPRSSGLGKIFCSCNVRLAWSIGTTRTRQFHFSFFYVFVSFFPGGQYNNTSTFCVLIAPINHTRLTKIRNI